MKKIAELNDIPKGGSKLVMIDDTPIALFNLKGKIHAWDNRCPHRGASLADGNISDSIIQCKSHLWEFDINAACAVANSDLKVKTFKVEVKEGSVFIDD
ncbi:MAG: Rieske 2Fe-2S domain-containing protein [Candidatus Marinimicrobia bacterium]|jgi:3-phenylpropionate/trans-cinnamate dioxygenase ferredoxin subunit|nr:Rieske 2Fe-2S domain-containing protein [Candidatus Neomarinimicrobiota bacterium]MBT3675637.1 Rieske 2Fe-2S domain-containing protein [Candidatus Neomarinimicrobiota bacterium]MBT3763404.1 Rieske 2Fe-2S domain-containing protein [Candidatus Neomarinimicrobiota bacterium]MBT4068084.1 Rieske 2Fe-2S domain-containing protein [Candidatus Neomarinimicrobiota bacterium]MBT4271178.1 Rieske 2Fe-2S domain-containing protein [Candidatus Neomarinimicrobiota bacterium]